MKRQINTGWRCVVFGLAVISAVVYVAQTRAIAADCISVSYWVFKDPYKNPVVPGPKFLGYWLPPVDDPDASFNADGTDYSYTMTGRPKGPFFDAGTHDGLDLFAWVDTDCKIHLFNKGDKVKPTTGGTIKSDGFEQGPDGVADIRPGSNPSQQQSYGHVDFNDNLSGQNVTTNTELGGLSDLGPDTFVHLHYGVTDENGKWIDPLSQMEMKTYKCCPSVPEGSTFVAASVYGVGFISLRRRYRHR